MLGKERMQLDIREKIEDILWELNSDQQRTRIKYLIDAIQIAYEAPETIYHCEQRILLPIAQEYHVTACAIRQGIYQEVKGIRQREDTKAFEKYFGKTIYDHREKLHSIRAIASISIYMRMQYSHKRLETRILKILWELGNFPCGEMFRYLELAIKMVYEKPNTKLQEFYTSIEKKYNVPIGGVRHKLEYEIKRIMEEIDTEVFEKYFGKIPYEYKNRLSKREVIATIAEYIHMQDRKK